MLRPLVVDIWALAFPVGLGALAFWSGRRSYRWPRWVQAVLVASAIGIVAGGVAAIVKLLPDHVNAFVSRIGGGTVLLSWVALFLIGVVWSAPKRSQSPIFLGCVVFLTGCLLVIEGSGPLWWRYDAHDLWRNFPDAQGQLQQSSGTTCSPTAAAMLLHCYGIRASEGEMAYLAGTSLLGSDGPQMARALDRKIESQGWRAFSRHMTYDECVRRGEPFLAHVQGATLGHAVLVKRITPDGVEIIDPVEGKSGTMTRADFENVWDGTVVGIERNGH